MVFRSFWKFKTFFRKT